MYIKAAYKDKEVREDVKSRKQANAKAAEHAKKGAEIVIAYKRTGDYLYIAYDKNRT